MAIYEFRCRSCGWIEMYPTRDVDELCARCLRGRMQRVWSFQMAPVWHAHPNHSTGTVVSDPRQFERDLARKSEEQTERTGIQHNYVPVDHSDTTKLGVTDAGLKETYDRKVKTDGEAPTWRL